jgi:actin-related protein
MFQNILVVGGNTMIPGFTQRLEKTLYSNAPESTKVKIFSYPRGFERRFSSWIGGSILASTGTFQNMWISKKEFEEVGSSIVKRKCCN